MKSLYRVVDTLSCLRSSVSFREFVTSPGYCGVTGIYDFWLDEFDKLSDPSELILDGSLGTGKTTAASYYLVYRLYKLFNMPDLRKYLGILPESPVFILYFSVSVTIAKRSGFQALINIVDSCKWFTNNFPRDKGLSSSIRFPNGFSVEYASQETHQISLDVIGFILDEANFRKGVGFGNDVEYREVTQLYTQLLDRQATRFSTPTGSKSFAILISSASYQSSFVETRKKAVSCSPFSASITSVSYKVKPQNYSKETFEVFIGTGTVSPAIVTDEKHKQLLLRQLGMQSLGDFTDAYFIQVPETLRPYFQTNVALALQNHSGVPTQVVGRLFSNMNIVQRCLYTPSATWFPDFQVTLSNQDDFQLMDILDLTAIEYPERPHSFFLDLSISGDPGGFACFRNDSTNDRKFHTHVFTLSVMPPPFPGETKLSKFVDFFIALSEHVTVAAVATDAYASKQIRQELLDVLYIPDTRFSIDSSDEFFIHWMRGMVEGYCNIISYPALLSELKSLVHNLKTRKVVKAANSHDDVSQATCGAYFLSSIYTDASLDTDLHTLRRNIVGRQAVRNVARYVGY